MAAEDKFGVKIPDDELPKLKTVGDAVNYIKEQLTDRPADACPRGPTEQIHTVRTSEDRS